MRNIVMLGALVVGIASAASVGAQQDVSDDPAVRAANADIELEKANKLASRGKLDAAIPHYKKAIQLDPMGKQLAYYNLAEVEKVRGNCKKAVPYYQFYAEVVGTEEARKEVAASVEKCSKGWPMLHVKVEPKLDGQIFIDEVLASNDGEFGPVAMPPGEYSLKLEAIDHHPKSRTVRLSDEDADVEVALEKMTFFGTILVQVEPAKAQAKIRIYEGPSDQTKVVHEASSPMKEGGKVREGRHFVEVTAPGFDRWIRNVSVGRDDEAVVKVELSKSKPEELR